MRNAHCPEQRRPGDDSVGAKSVEAKDKAEALAGIEEGLWSADPATRSMAARMLGVERQVALALAKAPGYAGDLNWIGARINHPYAPTRQFARQALETQLAKIRANANLPASPPGVPAEPSGGARSSLYSRPPKTGLTVQLPGPPEEPVWSGFIDFLNRDPMDIWNRQFETWERIAAEDLEKELAAADVALEEQKKQAPVPGHDKDVPNYALPSRAVAALAEQKAKERQAELAAEDLETELAAGGRRFTLRGGSFPCARGAPGPRGSASLWAGPPAGKC